MSIEDPVIGKCIQCGVEVELGEGLCQKCWDRKAGNDTHQVLWKQNGPLAPIVKSSRKVKLRDGKEIYCSNCGRLHYQNWNRIAHIERLLCPECRKIVPRKPWKPLI